MVDMAMQNIIHQKRWRFWQKQKLNFNLTPPPPIGLADFKWVVGSTLSNYIKRSLTYRSSIAGCRKKIWKIRVAKQFGLRTTGLGAYSSLYLLHISVKRARQKRRYLMVFRTQKMWMKSKSWSFFSVKTLLLVFFFTATAPPLRNIFYRPA